jgi:hypothetical protein
MTKKIAILISACLVVLALAAGCGPGRTDDGGEVKESEQTAAEPLGKFEAGSPDDADIRLYLTADGTMVRAEGKRGGNWDKQAVFDGTPKSLGKPLADIKIWEHDGSETEVAKEDGTSAHPHSGPAHPPWRNHRHCVIQIGTHKLIVHC